MSVKLFLSRDGKTIGPFPEERVRDLYEKGKLDSDFEVWPEGGFAQKKTVDEYFSRPESEEDDPESENDYEEVEPIPKPKKKNKAGSNSKGEDNFGTPDVLYILQNLNDGTFIKNLTGTLIIFAGFTFALGLVALMAVMTLGVFAGVGPVAAIVARVLLILSLVYPTYFLFVSFVNTGLKIKKIKTSNFVMAPIVSAIIDILANNNLIFGLFVTIPLTIFSSVLVFVFVGFLEGIAAAATTLIYCITGCVGTFLLMKFSKEFFMVFFIIGQDVEVIRTKAEGLK